MSDLKTKHRVIRFEPVLDPPEPRPGTWHLILGVVFPAFVIGLEAVTHMCAEVFFDPIPTPWHIAAAGAVPAANLLLWLYLRRGTTTGEPWLPVVNGAAIAIASFYALLFLPLMPLAVIAVVAYGLGLLVFGPLMALISAARLRKLYRRQNTATAHNRRLYAGVALGVVVMLALDVPSAATRLGMQWAVSGNADTRERGVALLRNFGDDDLLLRLCYDSTSRSPGLLAWLVWAGGVVGNALDPWAPAADNVERTLTSSPAEAREIYYRVHGVPFNLKPAPYTRRQWARFNDFNFDSDLGGTEVGGRVRGLSLVGSRIDGSVSGDDAVGYLEWVVEFQNTATVPREARMELALPPGGVVSRATLWVNGEEREAAYGGRGEVRAAYQRVAVQQRRDPLLVTTKGADRVLAQAFPVPAGGTLKFKLGITAPLEFDGDAAARLTLPAIVDRNFSFAADTSHNLWIESKGTLSATVPALTAARAYGGQYRLTGSVSDAELAKTRQVITVARNPANAVRVASLQTGDTIRQDVAAMTPQRPDTLMLVVDASARMKGSREALIKALDAIPPGAKVGIMLASEPVGRLAPAVWSDVQKQAAVRLLQGARFAGGQDNAPALAEALAALEGEPHGLLLWVHGPQPVSFRATAGTFEQVATRLASYPQVALYAVEPGPNLVLPDLPWAWSAHSLPRMGRVDADLAGFFRRTFDSAPRLAATRTQVPTADGASAGSAHIARLWAYDRVLTLMRENATANRKAATELAARYQLVTPVSGAVVLETKQQYAEARLTPAGESTVPTVPEPHEWALLIIAALALLWLLLRDRLWPVRAA